MSVQSAPEAQNFWLRPLPGASLSGPYTEPEVRERFAAGAFTFPEQVAYQGSSKRNLTIVDTSGWERI